ncbi:hypothetical protein [Kitasatospora sp. HPMI-4]|uniref:hypothetical protein n=1 Tax=Kitasatospora sp. HPMI-4 TaxID=3448443 RepID=UPI003F1DAD14
MKPALLPAVLYRCTSYFDIEGTEHELVFSWEILSSCAEAFRHIRSAASGITQALPQEADQVVRPWLADPLAMSKLERDLQQGRLYELELPGSGSRIVLSLRPVLLLPMLPQRPRLCPADLLLGRRTWAR